MKKIAIIGGGITGLSTAYYLNKTLSAKKISAEIILIEKQSDLGGNIVTIKKDGFIFEAGPDCFISEKPAAVNLCMEIGLEKNLICTKEENKKTFILNKGRLDEMPDGLMMMVPTKVMPFIKSPLISFGGKLRMGMDLIIPRKKDADDESLGDFVRRRLGKEALNKIAEPLVAGIHAGDPETMSLKNTFPRFLDMEQKYGSVIKGMLAGMKEAKKFTHGKTSSIKKTLFMTLKNGLIELIDKLKEVIQNDVKIVTSSNAFSITKNINEQKVSYNIELENSTIENIDIVILTTPAYAAGNLIKNFDNELSSVLLNFPYVSSATVSIGFKRSEVTHSLKGFGFLIPKTENHKIMATTWTSSKWPFRAPEDSVLLRGFLGGTANEKMAYLAENEMIQIVLDEWKKIIGLSSLPIIHKAYKWIKAMPQYVMGHEKTVEKIEMMASKHKGLIISGNYLKGVGIADCIKNSEIIAQKVCDSLFRETL